MERPSARPSDPTRRQSPSKMDLWERCQFLWAQRYIVRRRHAPRQEQALGNAADETFTEFYRAKLRNGTNLAEAEVAELFELHWSAESEQVEDLHPHERSDLLDRGVAVTRAWYRAAGQFVEPLGVQVTVEREVREGDQVVELNGILDLLERRPDGSRAVVDHKVGRRRFGVEELYRSTQALVYSFATGATAFGIHACVINKASETFQASYREVTEDDAKLLGFKALIAQRQQRHAIRTGDFMPNRGHQLCSRRWCEEWRVCQHTFGGRVPA